MAPQNASFINKLLVGFKLRCPNCEQGVISESLLQIREICPVCKVRFERQPSESTGAMMLALPLISVLAIIGFIFLEIFFDFSRAFQMIFLTALIIVFSLLIYRHIRGMWIAITYMTGGLTTDEEFNTRS